MTKVTNFPKNNPLEKTSIQDNQNLANISVVSKYSLDQVPACEFLYFDTRLHSYSSGFHKTSIQ